VLCGLPLVGCLAEPGLIVTIILWALCGVFSAYQIQIFTEFARAVPNESRGQAISVASAGLLAVQGIGLLLGGAVTQVTTIFVAVAGAGAIGVLLAIPLAGARARHQRGQGLHPPPPPRHAAAPRHP
jgi:hypothetical protein